MDAEVSTGLTVLYKEEAEHVQRAHVCMSQQGETLKTHAQRHYTALIALSQTKCPDTFLWDNHVHGVCVRVRQREREREIKWTTCSTWGFWDGHPGRWVDWPFYCTESSRRPSAQPCNVDAPCEESDQRCGHINNTKQVETCSYSDVYAHTAHRDFVPAEGGSDEKHIKLRRWE